MIKIFCIIFSTFFLFSCTNSNRETQNTHTNTAQSLKRIAHAGGIYHGSTYTDSLQALNSNANKYDFFEIDMNFTSDGELVCIHDWDKLGTRKQNLFRFWKTSLVPPNLETFARFNSQQKEWENCTLDTLIQWLKENPNKKIVTDVKKHNKKALTLIARKYPNYVSQFIPQIYRLREFKHIQKLGYQDIIFTLYKLGRHKTKPALEAYKYNLFAVTMPKADVPTLGKKLKEQGVRIYTHTVNDENEFQQLRAMGVDEIYTDSLE